MQKIAFFDIDRTLYNYQAFLESFASQISKKYNLKEGEIDILKIIYEENKTKYGYFVPDKFIGPIVNHFSFMDAEFLNSIFWDRNMFDDNLYDDSRVLFDIAKIATIGILSKGDKKFQKEKIKKFNKIIDNKNIYIYIDKIDFIKELVIKYKEFKIYLVDDHSVVLSRAKEENKDVFTIMVNRSNTEIKNETIDAIVDNLYEIPAFVK